MKRYIIIMCAIGFTVQASQSYAQMFSPDRTENCSTYDAIGLQRPCPSNPDGTLQVIIGADMNSIKSCTACNSGYTLKSTTLKDCGKTYSYNTCTGNCSSTCGNNTTEWKTVGLGYETREYEYCFASTTCKKKTQYRCAEGYYGSSTNGTSGCTVCPSKRWGATTTPPDNPDQSAQVIGGAITKCYFPAYTDIKNEISGTYQYTETCYYKNDPLIINPNL